MRDGQVVGARPTSGARTAGCRRRLDEGWSAVRVTHAEAQRVRSDGGWRLRIRAVVHLGALLPADVYVHATPPGDSGSGALRLWSVQSYRNGSFVFEAAVPDDASGGTVGGQEVLVRVRPAGGDHEDSVLQAVAPRARRESRGARAT